MQAEANIVQIYRELPSRARSPGALRRALAKKGLNVPEATTLRAVRLMAAMDCKTDNILRAANTLLRVVDLVGLPASVPFAGHIKDAEDVLLGIKPLVSDFAFREFRHALALVFAVRDWFHEYDRQLAFLATNDARGVAASRTPAHANTPGAGGAESSSGPISTSTTRPLPWVGDV